MPQAFFVLICVHCDTSVHVKRGDLPERCPVCLAHAHWRVAISGEYTKSDRRFLKAMRISAEV
jgi:hypothetical protein